jgi:hypothetical protein
LNYCDQALIDDPLKGGTNQSWGFAVAHCCKGRVLAKLGRADEAFVEFSKGAAIAHEHNYPFIEAIALRDWGNALPAGSREASAIARKFAAAMLPLGFECREAIAACVAEIFIWDR